MKRFFKSYLSVPTLTLFLVCLIELVRGTPYEIPNPPALLLMVVVYSAFTSGTVSGLISACIAWGYFAYFFSESSAALTYTAENLRRIIVWAIATPAIALMVGHLKRKSIERIEAENAKEIQAQARLNDARRASDTAEESEARFRQFADAMTQLAWMANADGWIHWYNERWYEYTGTTPIQMEGWGWQKVHDPKELPRVMEEWKRGIASRQPVEMTFPLRKHDGTFRWFLTQVTPVKDSSGKVLSWLGTNTDIDDQKRTADALRESRSRYAALNETIPQLVWTCRADGYCDYLSRQWIEYTEIPEEQQLGFSWLEQVIHPDDRKLTLEHWLGAVEGRHPYDIEYRIRKGDGSYRWFKTRGTQIRDDKGETTHWVGTCTDVHDQKLIAQALAAAKDEAERANTLKSAFLANMSHEIRTPLGAMMGFADLLSDPGVGAAEKANYIDILLRNGEQLGRVINDILDLSKVETGHVDLEYLRVSPLQIANEVVSLMTVVAKEKGLALSFVDDGTTPDQIVTDPTRMRQVLINLVGNSLKFTKVGSIRIALSGFEGESGEKCCAFEITDTGSGISEDSVDRLFKIFSQADNSMTRRYGGTGLGLALSRSLARLMGGDVRLVRSERDAGSTFRFSVQSREDLLPALSAPSESRDRELEAAIPIDVLKDVRILLVEDSADNQQLIWRYLSKYGALIEIADNGLEGVAKAQAGDHDIILMDLQMPIMDGYTAVGKLRANGHRKPIIALTAHAMSDVRKKCQDVGYTDHLPKPINSRNLVEAISRNVDAARSPVAN